MNFKKILLSFLVVILVFSGVNTVFADSNDKVELKDINPDGQFFLLETVNDEGQTVIEVFAQNYNIQDFQINLKYTPDVKVISHDFSEEFVAYTKSKRALYLSNDDTENDLVIFTGVCVNCTEKYTGKIAEVTIDIVNNASVLVYDGIEYGEKFLSKSYNELLTYADFVLDLEINASVYLTGTCDSNGNYSIKINANKGNFSQFDFSIKYDGEITDVKFDYSPSFTGGMNFCNHIEENNILVFTGASVNAKNKSYTGTVAEISFRSDSDVLLSLYDRLQYGASYDVKDYSFINNIALDTLEFGASYNNVIYTYGEKGSKVICDYDGKSSILTIPANEKIVKIYSNAFSNSKNLTNVIIPEGVEEIGSRAFSGCKKLTAITIPDSVTYIAPDAFENCGKVIAMGSDTLIPVIENVENLELMKKISVPEKDLEISFDKEDEEKPLINIINIEVTIEEIKIEHDEEFTGYFVIKTDSFTEKSVLKTIDIGNVSKVESGAISGCDNLEEIKFKGDSIEIGEDIVSDCKSLNKVSIIGNSINLSSDINLDLNGGILLLGTNDMSGINNTITIPEGNLVVPFDQKVNADKIAGSNTSVNGLGDIDDDNKMSAKDALEVLRISAVIKIDPSELEKVLADANCDTKINAVDALDILKYAAKIIDSISVQ